MVDPKQFWSLDEQISSLPGLSEDQLRDCGNRFGVTWPEAFARLYSTQNGGGIRDEYLSLFPLPVAGDEYSPVVSIEQIAAEDQSVARFVHDELGAPQLVLLIAGEGSFFHALDFNVNGPDGEPRVVVLEFDDGMCREVSSSFHEFVDDLARSESLPAVDLKAVKHLPLLAHVRVDRQYEDGACERIDQHVCDAATAFVLFIERNGTDGHELQRIELPKPLNPDYCVISEEEDEPQFVLALEPENDEDAPCICSRETSDGRWKNETTRGLIAEVEIEATDKFQLRALRNRLLGDVAESLDDDDN